MSKWISCAILLAGLAIHNNQICVVPVIDEVHGEVLAFGHFVPLATATGICNPSDDQIRRYT